MELWALYNEENDMERADKNLEITTAELSERLKQAAPLILLDCREPEEYQFCHLPESLHIPMNQIPGRLDDLDPEQDLVVICHHGVRSLAVTRWLREAAGYARVWSLRGGINAWSLDVDPSVPLY